MYFTISRLMIESGCYYFLNFDFIQFLHFVLTRLHKILTFFHLRYYNPFVLKKIYFCFKIRPKSFCQFQSDRIQSKDILSNTFISLIINMFKVKELTFYIKKNLKYVLFKQYFRFSPAKITISTVKTKNEIIQSLK